MTPTQRKFYDDFNTRHQLRMNVLKNISEIKFQPFDKSQLKIRGMKQFCIDLTSKILQGTPFGINYVNEKIGLSSTNHGHLHLAQIRLYGLSHDYSGNINEFTQLPNGIHIYTDVGIEDFESDLDLESRKISVGEGTFPERYSDLAEDIESYKFEVPQKPKAFLENRINPK